MAPRRVGCLAEAAWATRWKILGAWLRIWTPPRDVEVPPVPLRAIAPSPSPARRLSWQASGASRRNGRGDEYVSVAGGGVALGRRGVDALLDDVQANASLAELRAEGDEVQDRAPEPIQTRDLQRVTVAGLSRAGGCARGLRRAAAGAGADAFIPPIGTGEALLDVLAAGLHSR